MDNGQGAMGNGQGAMGNGQGAIKETYNKISIKIRWLH